MTTGREESVEAAETADEYGRREQCFIDYARYPFCFEACIPHIQTIVMDMDEDGLFDLTPSQWPVIDDCFEPREDLVEAFLELPQDASMRTSPLIPGLDIYQDLLVSVESLALPSDPEADLREYFKEVSDKRFGQPLKTWLPLCSVSVEKDEDLPLPSHSKRLRSLLQREAEHENLVLPEEALVHVEEIHRSSYSQSIELQAHLDCLARSRQVHNTYPEPMTPPVFLSSDDDSPFVPNNAGNIIDLTSEPSSPVDEHYLLLQKTLEDEGLGPDPIEPLSLLGSSPSEILPDVESSHWKCQGLKVDVPIMLSSSDLSYEEDILTNALSPMPTDADSLAPPNEEEQRSDDAFKALLKSRAAHVKSRAEQEHLNPLNSVSRVQVPILDFDISPPDWTTNCSNAQSHFGWLRDYMVACFTIPPVPRDCGSQSALRWNPIPPKFIRVSMNEELPCSIDLAQSFLKDVVPTLSSFSFFATERRMTVLATTEDYELDYPATPPPDDERPRSLRSTLNRDEEEIGQIDSIQEAQPGPLFNQDWSTILGSIPKEVREVETNLLPKSSDTSATSALVSSFMQLRGKKTQPKARTPISDRSTTPLRNQHRVLPTIQEIPLPVAENPKVPAMAPSVQVPAEKGSFIISLGLSRSILNHIEALWPSSNLIDMDHSRWNTMIPSPGTGQPREALSTLSFEADISLTPSAGVTVTNLLKVRQRALPGSKGLAPLKERVQRVSEKYETLTVLVSESNPAGEFAGVLTASDAAMYADFVRFTLALDGDVCVNFVPGADATLAKWILCLMCQQSHQAASLKRFLSGQESPWELLLRQAGMNVMAAKVLAGSLFEEAGPSGLARYLITPAEERISRFATILGGEKILRSSSEKLDRQWG